MTINVPNQEVLTKYSLTISVESVINFRVSDPVSAITKVENYNLSIELLSRSTLRHVLNMKTLSEVLSDYQIISKDMINMMNEASKRWGIEILNFSLKNVKIVDEQLLKIFAIEAQTERKSNANLILARAEFSSAHALKQASVNLTTNAV